MSRPCPHHGRTCPVECEWGDYLGESAAWDRDHAADLSNRER